MGSVVRDKAVGGGCSWCGVKPAVSFSLVEPVFGGKTDFVLCVPCRGILRGVFEDFARGLVVTAEKKAKAAAVYLP